MVSNSQTERSQKQSQPKEAIATHQKRKAAFQINNAIKAGKLIGALELSNMAVLNKILENKCDSLKKEMFKWMVTLNI